MRDVILHPHALSELREANLYYAEISFRLADAFADRVNQSRHPDYWKERLKDNDG